MNLIRYREPTTVSLFNEFDRFFNEAFANFNRWPSAFGERAWNDFRAPTDLYEDGDNYYARVELPGVPKEAVKVQLENGQLSVEARSGDGQASSAYFYRSLTVPRDIHPEKVQAKLEDGVLTLTLPKGESARARAIDVN